jgi:RNA polymerase sigma-70 factor (ECF subfamily)
METTSITLLELLRTPGRPDAWPRFVRLYTPLLVRWANRLQVPPDDRPDLLQEVFLALYRALPAFRHGPGRSFRAWAYTVAEFDEAEYRAVLVAQASRLVRAEFTEPTWRAFWATAVEGRQAAEVAGELGLTPNAVYLARSRVLARLRGELAGLLD